MDKDNDGIIKVSDIKGVYSAKNAPDVKNGKKNWRLGIGRIFGYFWNASWNSLCQSKGKLSHSKGMDWIL